MKVAIIGGGNLGSAFGAGLLQGRVVAPPNLLVVETKAEQRTKLELSLCCSTTNTVKLVDSYDVLMLAVKPQDMQGMCETLVPHLRPDQLVISPMAGVKLQTLRDNLKQHQLLVRCMPNLPAKIGQGMTAYIPAPGFNPFQIATTERILGAVGSVLRVQDELLIDAATAISGSGPAYVFYLVEHMLQAATELGFSKDEATELIGRTFIGAIELWLADGTAPADLRKMVASKGGTTEAAFSIFEKGALGDVLSQGIKRAFQRAQELSK